MTFGELAAIHAAAMTVPEPWSAVTLKSFAEAPGGFVVTTAHGFALGRVIADEAELLTIAVDPGAQGRGEGRACLAAFESAAAERGARRGFLEVAETNAPARALYAKAHWRQDGKRRGYYRAADGARIDALLLSKELDGQNR